MVKIGVIGGFSQISEILIKLCGEAGLKILTSEANDDTTPSAADILVAEITDALDNADFNIIILNQIESEFTVNLNNDGIFIVNSDDKNNFSLLKSGRAKLITYGFNSKSCVTASSVTSGDYQTIQCCIQRSLPTLSANIIEEQEFPINAPNKDIYSVLAAVTAALINDIITPAASPIIF